MDSLRKWFYKPRRDDQSLLAQFFYADEALNLVAAELDSFDGRKDPERCSSLVNHLRQCQDKVLNICNRIMDELIPNERADRDFRVKFPDDVMQDNLAGQLWFGAECLAAGSSIMNRETESGSMRPLAKALTKSLENVRNLLREASLRTHAPSELAHDRLIESLKMFDRLLADFELCYVSAMVPVKTIQEYQLQQDVVVLFSETLQRALKLGLLSQETVDQCDPALMFTIPRLAIVTGLLVYPEGPLSLDTSPHHMSEMFRPFRTLLVKIRELLWTLTEAELLTLEKMLCSSEDPGLLSRKPSSNGVADLSEEESSGWGGEGEGSECETVMEQLPATLVPADDSGVVTLQSTSDSPESLDDVPQQTSTETEGPSTPDEADDESDGEEGVINLNGQWTLPIIPCACSVDISEDATMTKQGLLNRSLQQDTIDNTCEECLLKQMNESKTEVPSKTEEDGEDNEDVRWACDTDVPSTSERDTQTENNESSVNSVQSDSSRDIINTDNYNKFKPNVNLNDSKVKCVEWKPKSQSGQSSEDLHVRYAENWEALCSSGPLPKDCDNRQRSEHAVDSLSSSCSSCHTTLTSSVTSDSCSITSETSSFNSDCQDDEEVALALKAVQHATKMEARAKFRSSGDLLHRLFVCISGVADQLQTNFAGDLRHILKSVFLINSSDSKPEEEEEIPEIPPEVCEDALEWGGNTQEGLVEAAPLWLPDEAAPVCMACHAMFTVIRRRHHCRNCGKVFCARCSSNSVPLPRYGHAKPVRVCNRCLIYKVTPSSGFRCSVRDAAPTLCLCLAMDMPSLSEYAIAASYTK
ncbi:lateral signaling target protein 2 homolog [Macrosteles quadrilineatus]|uniref:lateral signaling target protein 2 homolog n=1 Tax=Macrosteles quadrilineatus TaxID=74068 RepID=UPI0023E2DA14|nr:lateral signaling target protein 2 homolog [Macrosteles quadrilineatus]